MPAPAVIALLTDFGLQDGYAGVMKGVILGIAPGAALVDLSHEVPAQDVLGGAWVLHTAWRYFAPGTIFVAVVDPGVGSARRAVAFAAGGCVFVGPDNGVFSYVLDAAPPEQPVLLDRPTYHLSRPSATFHGRDIFAPVAAHLAIGVALHEVGTPVDGGELVRLTLPTPEWRGEALIAHVVHVDVFGNVILDLDPEQTDVALASLHLILRVGGRAITVRARTFVEAPAGEVAMLRDSSGHLAIVLRDGSAARALGLTHGDDIAIIGLQPPRDA